MNLCRTFKQTSLALAVSFSLGFASTAYAVGESHGSLNGAVIARDAHIAGATITIVNKDNGLIRTVQSDENGHFRLTQLPVGEYEVRVTKEGFVAPAVQTISVRLGAGTSLNVALQEPATETVEVIGSHVSSIDMQATDSGLTINEGAFDRLPNMRSMNSVALLAPGALQSDSGFDGLPTFSGASAAENVYYINGLNITDLRRGLGGADIPFEFFREFQVKSGGYSAEYGRSTGGVVNAVTKSGGNEWTGGANVYWSPASWQGQSPNVYNSEGTLMSSGDDADDREYNFQVGGPLIQDKLFLFALYNPRDIREDYVDNGSRYYTRNNDAFWGVKLDYFLTSDHTFEYTIFSNRYDKNWHEYRPKNGNAIRLDSTDESGGINQVLRYTGLLTDSFSMSVLFGQTETGVRTVSGNDSNPVILYSTDGANYSNLGNWSNTFVNHDSADERDVERIDFDWDVGGHTLSFGLDHETLKSNEDSAYSGGVLYYIDDYEAEDPTATSEVWVQHRRIYGKFESESQAMYLEGTFRLGDVTVTAGLRNEMFENRDGLGGTFIEMKNKSLSMDDLLMKDSENQWAARYGIAWDIGGDGNDKLYANIGRYFLPVANILNVKLAGAYYRDRTIYEYAGVLNADDTPQTGAVISPFRIQFDGEVNDARSIVNQDIKPMYQDEVIIGYSRTLADQWSANVSFVYRDLKRAIEDSTPCKGLDAIAAQRYGYDATGEGSFCYSITPPYVLTNPGEGLDFWFDFDQGDGYEHLQFTADELGYPKAKRTYKGLDFSFDRAFDGVWSLNVVYTWSKTSGNYEGTVNSDNPSVQSDAGFTTAFDFYSMLDNADGYLANDRRHSLKITGSWKFAEQWTLGFNWFSMSGRPINFLGVHPTDPNNQYYIGGGNFYQNGVAAPRGSGGRTSWVHGLDLSLQYDFTVFGASSYVRIDAGNVFNFDTATDVYSSGELFNGEPDPNYGEDYNFQKPRSVTLSAAVRF